jgi:pilus assembly protein CpaC
MNAFRRLQTLGAFLLALVADAHAISDEGTTPLRLVAGHVRVMSLPGAVSRIAVGDPKVADYRLISPTELYVVGKAAGTTNLVIWRDGLQPTTLRVSVTPDLAPLAESLNDNLPNEKSIDLRMASGRVVLSGMVSSPAAAAAALSLADAFMRPLQAAASAPSQVIDLLRVRDNQQVTLEVRIAEISRSVLDKLGLGVQASGNNGSWRAGSSFLGGGGASASLLFGGINGLSLEAEARSGLVRILAEPTIVAMSGQEGSFLVGGKVFIPVIQPGASTGSTITLQEREFGVGLKFVPQVLDAGRISLKVTTEVSEISREPVTLRSGATASVLPAFTSRRVATSVLLADGQSLVIGGLLRNSTTASINSFPFLGDLPVIGALFRSTEFIADMTELVVVVRATRVQASDVRPPLPTDRVVPPTRNELFWEQRLQGATPGSAP